MAFDFFVEVTETDEGLKQINEAIRELKSLEVLVGIPDSAASKGDGPVSKAELMFIHTHGSPVNNIPPRPVLEASLDHNVDTIADLLQKAADAAVDGNKEAIRPALEKTGTQAQNIAQRWFDDPANGWAPNSDITVQGGWMKNKSTGKVFKVEGKGSSRPLIDEGELRKAITFTVEKV